MEDTITYTQDEDFGPKSRYATQAQCLAMAATAVVAVVTILMGDPFWGVGQWNALTALCAWGILTSLGVAVSRLRYGSVNILSDTSTFMLLGCGVYYFIGPLVYVYGDEQTKANAFMYAGVSGNTAVKVTAMNMLGMSVSFFAFASASFDGFRRTAMAASMRYSSWSPGKVVCALLLVGYTSKYLFVLPFEIGMSTEVPSGVLRTLARLSIVGSLLLWGLVARGQTVLFCLAAGLTSIDMVVGILMLNKTEVLLPLSAALLGWYQVRASKMAIIIGVLFGFAVYVVIGPLVTYGREQLGGSSAATLAERSDILWQYASNVKQAGAGANARGRWWLRLCYVPDQANACRLFETGRGGSSLSLLPWILVPRSLYPQKPVMTDAGLDLTEKIKGSRHSSTGIGVFIDGYYNGGWLGLIVASALYGLVGRLGSDIASGVVAGEGLIMYPLVFSSIYLGLRVDGWLLTDVLGPIVMVVAMLFMFRIGAKAIL